MTDVKRDEKTGKNSWLAFAFLSAVFAAATSVLAKIGIKIGTIPHKTGVLRIVSAFVWREKKRFALHFYRLAVTLQLKTRPNVQCKSP